MQAVQRLDLCFWLCYDSLPLYLEEDLILESQVNPMPMQGLRNTSTQVSFVNTKFVIILQRRLTFMSPTVSGTQPTVIFFVL